jgi:gliding motility-associated-like protein
MLFPFSASTQNLVPNPSFEEYSDCPNGPGAVGLDELEKAIGWYKPNSATTDYYNSCASFSSGVSVPSNWFGYQPAYDGNGYAGVVIYDDVFPQASEYIQCKLIQSLKPCHEYQIQFWACLADFSPRASSALGLRLDATPISNSGAYEFWGFEMPSHISYNQTIKDTSNWVLISGTFLAKGNEEYLTIGRFLDTTLYSNFNPPYEVMDCDSCLTIGVPAQYYIDLVSVIEVGLANSESVINPNVITANQDGINDYWYPNSTCFSNWTCDIINRWGNIIFSFKENDIGWDGTDKEGELLSEGSYFYIIKGEQTNNSGFIQLVR